MHILLTDILTCPRCGPGFGLILLANRVAERRVQDGVLGCSNCREKYPIRDGAGDFGGVTALPRTAAADDPRLMRLAALLGITHGPGFILIVGPAAAHAHALAEMLPDVEIIASAYDAEAEPPTGGAERLSRLGIAQRLPLASGKVLGVALTGASASDLLEEGVRVLSPVGRLLLEPAPADADERLGRSGARVIARDGDTVLAARG